MTMEQELGSIMSHIYRNFPGCEQVYQIDIPAGFQVPSLYFPPPIITSQRFTSHSYQKGFQWFVKLFHKDQEQAFQAAEAVADSIRRNRNCIPLLNADGSATGRLKFIEAVNVRLIARADDHTHTAQITIEWSSRYNFDLPSYEKMAKIFYQMNDSPLSN